MRWIKKLIIFLSIAVLIFVIAAVLFVKFVDINKYTRVIEKSLSESIGAEVSIEKIAWQISVTDGLEIRLSDLIIREEASYYSAPFVNVHSVQCGIKVLKFIKDRSLEISHIDIDEPNVKVRKNEQGVFNIEKIFTKKKTEEKVNPADVSLQDAIQKPPPEKNNLIDFNRLVIKTINIRNGQLHYLDESALTPLQVDINDVEAHVSSFQFNKPFAFDVKANVFHTAQNVFISGNAFIDNRTGQVTLNNAQMTTDLAQQSPAMIGKVFPSFTHAEKVEDMQGKTRIDVSQMHFKDGKIGKLEGKVSLKDAKVDIDGLPHSLDHISGDGVLRHSEISINKLAAQFGSGQIEIAGSIEDYLKNPREEFSFNVTDFPLADILKGANIPIVLEGKLNGFLIGELRGVSPESMMTTLLAQGKWEILNGILKDINVLKFVLSKISFIPNLVNTIEQNLPESYKEKLERKDTPLNLVRTDVQWKQNRLFVNNAWVDADGFVLNLEGWMDRTQNVYCSGSLTIPAELSQLMVASAPDLSAFLDRTNRIQIPFKPYQGPLAEFILYPAFEDIAGRAIRNRGRQELQKVIFKALDIDEQQQADPNAAPAGEGEAAPSEAEPKAPEQQAVEGILDMIFQ